MIACRRRPCNGFGRPFGNLARTWAQRGNRVKQPAAIADKRDAKVFQILSGESRQDFAVDPVLAKGRLESFETQLLQPGSYVHAVLR
jgi:hypothetical protein